MAANERGEESIAGLCRREGIANFSLLVSHVLVPPAMTTILDGPANRVQGFLAAGHVCTVMGVAEYGPIARRHGVPIVVTGFEPLDILEGVWLCVRQLEAAQRPSRVPGPAVLGFTSTAFLPARRPNAAAASASGPQPWTWIRS